MYRYLNLGLVEDYVDTTPNAWWEGWDIKYFTPNPSAVYNKDGVWHDGKFGFVYTVRPNKNGEWRVKVESPRRPRS